MAGHFNLRTLAVKNLKRRSLRTAILVTSIGLFVSILVFGLSFVMGVSASLRKSIDRLGADVLVVPYGAQDYAEDVLLESNKAKSFYMDKDIVEKVKEVKGVGPVTWQTYLTTIAGLC
ncbi:MAG: hypothetical protein M0Z48_09385 [Nitrospiraceae bacterium]|nr:hypothetical protein [Nitrospiraceae bacterium]